MTKILDITNIRSMTNKYNGLAKPSLFLVHITPPASLVKESVTKDLGFFCNTVNIPGINFVTDGIRHKGYGIKENRMVDIDFDDLQCTFFCDNKAAVENFFYKWFQKMYNFDFKAANSKSQGTSSETFGYPKDTEGTLTITGYNTSNDQIISYNFDKVKIKSIGSIQMGWELVDTLKILPITFSFRSMSTNKTVTNDIKPNTNITAVNQQRDLLTQINMTRNPEAVESFLNTASQYLSGLSI